MNHGKVNQIYYADKSKKTAFEIKYPQAYKYMLYFNNFKSRDRYYICLKNEVALKVKKLYPEITLQDLALTLGLTNHASALWYLRDNFKKGDDHDEFIELYMDKCIDNFLYPKTTTSGRDFKKYGPFKLIEKLPIK